MEIYVITMSRYWPLNMHYSFIHQWLYSSCWALASSSVSESFFTQTVGLFGEWSARRKAATYTQGNINTEKRTYKHPCLWLGFEPTIPVFERAKTVHALDRTATVIGEYALHCIQIHDTCECVFRIDFNVRRVVESKCKSILVVMGFQIFMIVL
jgi:hypothetical protein